MISLPLPTQARLEQQLDTLFIFTDPLSDLQLRKQVVDGKWSVLLHMAHLARYQEVFIQRLDRIMLEELPGLPAYQAEGDFGWGIWQAADRTIISQHLKETRNTLLELAKGYSPAQLKRQGYHPRLGAMDVGQWLEFFLLHEAHHLYTIFQLRQEYL